MIRPGEPIVILRTVDQAIDEVQKLPEEARGTPRWRPVEELLFKANETHDPTDLRNAYDALLKSMREEKHWKVSELP